MKLLSEDPANYKDAPTEGIRKTLEVETGTELLRTDKVDTSQILSIRMGTTVRAPPCAADQAPKLLADISWGR